MHYQNTARFILKLEDARRTGTKALGKSYNRFSVDGFVENPKPGTLRISENRTPNLVP